MSRKHSLVPPPGDPPGPRRRCSLGCFFSMPVLGCLRCSLLWALGSRSRPPLPAEPWFPRGRGCQSSVEPSISTGVGGGGCVCFCVLGSHGSRGCLVPCQGPQAKAHLCPPGQASVSPAPLGGVELSLREDYLPCPLPSQCVLLLVRNPTSTWGLSLASQLAMGSEPWSCSFSPGLSPFCAFVAPAPVQADAGRHAQGS